MSSKWDVSSNFSHKAFFSYEPFIWEIMYMSKIFDRIHIYSDSGEATPISKHLDQHKWAKANNSTQTKHAHLIVDTI